MIARCTLHEHADCLQVLTEFQAVKEAQVADKAAWAKDRLVTCEVLSHALVVDTMAKAVQKEEGRLAVKVCFLLLRADQTFLVWSSLL